MDVATTKDGRARHARPARRRRRTIRRPLAIAIAIAGLLTAAVGAVSPAGARDASVPAQGAAIHDPLRVDGARRLPGGAVAVPLRARPPAWLTAGLLAQAATGPRALPAGTGDDLPASGFVGIRPGSWMVSPSGCTMGFVFGSPGTYSIGTAGHCVRRVGDDVYLATVAPAGDNVGGWVLVRIGKVVVRRDNGVGDDFALVAVDSRYQSWVFPTMAQVLGPCAPPRDRSDGVVHVQGWNPLVRGEHDLTLGETVFHYGHGVAVGAGGTARSGAVTAQSVDAYYWAGAAAPGDSGSATRTQDFRPAGNLTHFVLDLKVPAYVAGTRAGRMEAIAGVPIATSPLC